MKINKKMLIVLALSIVFLSFGNQVKAETELDPEEVVVLGMNWVDKDGNLVDESGNPLRITPFSTFTGNCGSATLTASSSLVTVVIRPYGWVAWYFSGQVNDTSGFPHYFSVSNFDNTDVYRLSRLYRRRTLTLTGTATDITGKMCAVVPNASINHYW